MKVASLGLAASLVLALSAPLPTMAADTVASAAGRLAFTQCGLLAGKRFLVETEDDTYQGIAVFDFPAAGPGTMGTANAFVGFKAVPAGRTWVEPLLRDTELFSWQSHDDIPAGKPFSPYGKGPYCGVNLNNAYYAFQTPTPVRAGAAPIVYHGNNYFAGKRARVYVLPQPWAPN
jgi:hypothetical protein